MEICPEKPYLVKIGKKYGHLHADFSTCYCWSALLEWNGVRLSDDI